MRVIWANQIEMTLCLIHFHNNSLNSVFFFLFFSSLLIFCSFRNLSTHANLIWSYVNGQSRDTMQLLITSMLSIDFEFETHTHRHRGIHTHQNRVTTTPNRIRFEQKLLMQQRTQTAQTHTQHDRKKPLNLPHSIGTFLNAISEPYLKHLANVSSALRCLL